MKKKTKVLVGAILLVAVLVCGVVSLKQKPHNEMAGDPPIMMKY